jgi:hypothetical protein
MKFKRRELRKNIMDEIYRIFNPVKQKTIIKDRRSYSIISEKDNNSFNQNLSE